MKVRRSRLFGCGVVVLAATAWACGAPSDGEAAVCATLQEVVDELAAGRSQEALDTFGALRSQADASGNANLQREATALWSVLDTPVTNAGDLTIAESAEVGNQALAASAGYLGAIGDECARIGLAVEVSPQLGAGS